MDPSTTQAHIRELESVRKQTNLWRLGATLVIVVTLVVSLWLLYADAKALASQGPTQERFVSRLQEGMNERVVPQLKETMGNTLTEMRPVVQAEFVKLNTRVPDITQASLKQVDELQKSLPAKGQKVLDETFGAALRDEEPEIRKMFPDATEEQVKGLVTSLTTAVNERGPNLADELLTPHLTAMQKIHENLRRIQASDQGGSGAEDDWAMGLAVFDVIREDVKGLEIKPGEAAKAVSAAAQKVADAAKNVQDAATHVKGEADKKANEGVK